MARQPRRPGGNRRTAPTVSEITAPYNFVPLSDFVHQPDWVHSISHDMPFHDGICGSITIEITTHTEILVGGEQKKAAGGKPGEIFFAKNTSGKYVIPGTALKGMVRSVLEIASFGKMNLVEDQHFGVRDLGDTAKLFYRDLLVGNSEAGWLTFEKGSWYLRPCQFARVHFSQLQAMGATGDLSWLRKRSSAQERYRDWNSCGLKLDQKLNIGKQTATKDGSGTPESGVLVFTGNTGVPRRPKSKEFFFYRNCAKSMDVPPDVFKRFNDLASVDEKSDWNWWLKRYKKKHCNKIPVFWISDGSGGVQDVGLAMMFKLPYRNSVRRQIENTSADHGRRDVVDMAEAMFGSASDVDGDESESGSLKSRVSFDDVQCVDTPETCQVGPILLSTPKPSFYPSYVCQPVQEKLPGKLKGPTYATYTSLPDADEPEVRRPEIRGWKRYPVRPKVNPGDGWSNGNAPRMTNILHALKPTPPVHFEGVVRFHNLKPEELGALLWVLEWGGNPDLRHAIGMGKPFGMGQISIQVKNPVYLPNCPGAWPSGIPEESVKLMTCFEKHMNRAYIASGLESPRNPQWKSSEQLKQLCAMANPRKSTGKILRHMELFRFQDSKKERLVLQPYV